MRRTALGADGELFPAPSPSGWGPGEWGRFARVCLTLVNESGIQLGKQTRWSRGWEKGGGEERRSKASSTICAVRASLPPSPERGCSRFARPRSGLSGRAAAVGGGSGQAVGSQPDVVGHCHGPPTLRDAGASPSQEPLSAPQRRPRQVSASSLLPHIHSGTASTAGSAHVITPGCSGRMPPPPPPPHTCRECYSSPFVVGY